MSKRTLYNIVLCFHGFVQDSADAVTFRSYVGDFQAIIQNLQNLGYTFIPPSLVNEWYMGTASPPEPWACVTTDDGLDSVLYVSDWLIQNKIPFSCSIIARRFRKIGSESGFMTWAQFKSLVDSGYCEWLYHTYNLHHMNLSVNQNTNLLEAAPILDHPCWLDSPADFLYILPGDTRWYFDYTLIDDSTWGFPLFGTDPSTNELVTSTIVFQAQQTLTVTDLRVWAALHMPPSSGYDCEVVITINGTQVFDQVIAPYQYETRAQWFERQFASFHLDTPFNVTAGQSYTMVWTSKTQGPDCFRIYGIPDFSGNYTLQTNVTGQDYNPGQLWPARPAIILASGQGSTVTDAEYSSYVQADFANYQSAINNYYNAVWTEHSNPYNPNNPELYCISLAGTYEDGTKADTMVRFHPDTSFTAEVLQFKYCTRAGDRYALIVDIYIGERTGPQTISNPVKVARWAANWDDWHEVQIDIDPYTFDASTDYYIHFVTMNQGPSLGLIRAYMDQPQPPSPVWEGGASGGWVDDGSFSFDDWYVTNCVGTPTAHDAGPLTTTHTDVWPDGWWTDASDNWFWSYDSNMAGPGVCFLDFYSRTSTPVTFPATVAYPFGAYYDDSDTSGGTIISQVNVNSALQTVLNQYHVSYGYTIWPARVVPKSIYREPDMETSQYALPRVIMYGDIGLDNVNNNIEGYVNALWTSDVDHKGLKWLGYEEQNSSPNATISLAKGLNFVGFDAYYVQSGGTINADTTNINWTDKSTLQSQGVQALILFNNYSATIDDFDGNIAAEVFANPNTYIPLMVDKVTGENWDGLVIDFENVPDNSKAEANNFYRQLALAMVPLKKAIHTALPALTGTSYDASGWALWCDYANILPFVDYALIMTYTETGPGTDPGPHAPDWFFTEVYDYITSVVEKRYWPRILVGANVYGHEWYAANPSDPPNSTCDYMSFHGALADAIRYGAEIQFQDGEAYWTKAGRTCWFGDQNTVNRAVQKALDKGFGGVGLWKLDDGDALTQWPKYGSPRTFAFPAMRIFPP